MWIYLQASGANLLYKWEIKPNLTRALLPNVITKMASTPHGGDKKCTPISTLSRNISHIIPLCLFSSQVLFKMVLGSAKFGEAALFLSIVGSANFVFLSFVPVILYFTHVEYISSPADIPWAYLCGVAGLLFGTR